LSLTGGAFTATVPVEVSTSRSARYPLRTIRRVTVLVDLTGIPGDIVDDDLGLQSRCQHPPATDEDGLEQRPARTDHVAGSLESSLLSTTLKHGVSSRQRANAGLHQSSASLRSSSGNARPP
jgi:hypothetical protein